MEEERFWMIYGERQGSPTVRHKTFASAKGEAERLARCTPGIRFFILETVGAVQKVDVQFTDLRDYDAQIPF